MNPPKKEPKVPPIYTPTLIKEAVAELKQAVMESQKYASTRRMTMTNFINEEHRQLFEKEVYLLPENYQQSSEFLSLVYIMTSSTEMYRKMKPHFRGELGEFDAFSMFEQDFSSGHYVLAKLASHLYNNGKEISPLNLIESLDTENMDVAMNAIYIRKTGRV